MAGADLTADCTNFAFQFPLAQPRENCRSDDHSYCRKSATNGTNRPRHFCGEATGGLVKARREMPGEKFIEFVRPRFQYKS
jgi:hypothetical protein